MTNHTYLSRNNILRDYELTCDVLQRAQAQLDAVNDLGIALVNAGLAGMVSASVIRDALSLALVAEERQLKDKIDILQTQVGAFCVINGVMDHELATDEYIARWHSGQAPKP